MKKGEFYKMKKVLSGHEDSGVLDVGMVVKLVNVIPDQARYEFESKGKNPAKFHIVCHFEEGLIEFEKDYLEAVKA